MKVLTILVDGMRPDSFTNVDAAQKIISRSKSTMSARTLMPSVTLPCHFSLFHSVEPSRHGITTNLYMPQVRPIRGICEVLRASGKSCAFFYDWHELRDLARPGSLSYECFINSHNFGGYAGSGKLLTDATIDFLYNNPTDFTFFYDGYPDSAGHSFGWMSPEYMDSVKNAWDNITRIVDALPEDYTVIILADHGGHDRCHGTDMPEDMTIPIVILGSAYNKVGSLDNANIMDVAPTVLDILGVEPDKEWEGHSLLLRQ
ncbi:MAG: alkaline phosphatase family protein [Clostridia bacterium]|nr:alkaline phosphatase family protein [Clostridia bacterium]